MFRRLLQRIFPKTKTDPWNVVCGGCKSPDGLIRRFDVFGDALGWCKPCWDEHEAYSEFVRFCSRRERAEDAVDAAWERSK